MSALSPDASVWLVGAGNMGGAMLRGWQACGIDRDRVRVITRSRPPPAGAWPDVLVLACKPQQLRAARDGLGDRPGAPGLLLSVLAGTAIATLQRAFGARQTVRAMPNLPSAIGRGVTLLHGGAGDARDSAEALVAPLGAIEWIGDETLFDAATALAGCGPGFTFRFIDALAAAGEALGLDRAVADRLAQATVAGSAAMAVGADENAAVLADRVASPGGSTREGLDVLDADGALAALLRRTLAASAARNRTLAAETAQLFASPSSTAQ